MRIESSGLSESAGSIVSSEPSLSAESSGSNGGWTRVRTVGAGIGIVAIVLSSCSTGGSDSSQSPSPSATTATSSVASNYPIVSTDQIQCYDNDSEIECPKKGENFFGQNGNHRGDGPTYVDNGDKTITDKVSGLMWQQDPGSKMSYDKAVAGADTFKLAGHEDWRLPTIKEIYSIALFNGVDASSYQGQDTSVLRPFLDTQYFDFSYGGTESIGSQNQGGSGARIIDSQYATSTLYESTVMNGQKCFFGFNFADARIKCYPATGNQTWFVRYVRDAPNYGKNSLADSGNGTVADATTVLAWQQKDSGKGMNWQKALAYCETLELGSTSDWRLPNVKELQSIVDYSKSPGTTKSAAIDPVFDTSSITNEAGDADFPAYWTSTTLVAYPDNVSEAAYVAFGRAMGNLNGKWIDVHGAGAQRSDPKVGSASDFPSGRGPQGDAIRVDNYVRCVTGGTESAS